MAELNAFRERFELADEDVRDGPLQGLTFAVKDVFDVAGRTTGGGVPDWLRTHEPAPKTAPVVLDCLRAGARLVGVTIADEMSFSPFGENVHYGTPLNPAAPDRVPGGSSSGSASATAGGAVDFALGADTAGSVRIPASYCGLFGIRPTHGRLSSEGVMPLARSYDAPGWFARDAALLERVGDVLLGGSRDEARPVGRLLRLREAFELADPAARPVLEQALERVSRALGVQAEPVTLDENRYDDWVDAFNTLRRPEIWAAHGEWITRVQPKLGSKTAARFAVVRESIGSDTTEAAALRARVKRRAAEMLGGGGVFVLPTVPSVAPPKGMSDEAAPEMRRALFRLTCIAPMLGFPEITLPLGRVDGYPVGLSLLGPAGADRSLLRAAVEVSSAAT